jgi:predicted nuclease of predicted toxin-antitoxin system
VARLYLDQMFRIELAALLRDAGHDVVQASEIGQARADDAQILERAVQEERTLVTLDGHFGDWVVLPLSEHFGVIRVKAHPTSSENVARVLLPLLMNHSPVSFRNKLVIASQNRVRWIQTKGAS